MFNIRIEEVMGRKAPKKGIGFGHVGIELELEWSRGLRPEFDRLQMAFSTQHLSMHEDGSLNNGLEVVTIPFDITTVKSREAVRHQFAQGLEMTRPDFSERASTHVHVNVARYTHLQLLNVVTALWIVENVLFQFCTEERRNNHFCIGFSDTGVLVERIVDAIRNGQFPRVDQDNGKYSAVNIGRVYDIGTVEIRIRECLLDADEIISWALMLNTIVRNAAVWGITPKELIQVACEDPLALIRALFGDFAEKAFEKLRFGEDNEPLKRNLQLLVPLYQLDYTKDYRKGLGNENGGIGARQRLLEQLRFVDDDIGIPEEIVEFDDLDVVQVPQEEAPRPQRPAELNINMARLDQVMDNPNPLARPG